MPTSNLVFGAACAFFILLGAACGLIAAICFWLNFLWYGAGFLAAALCALIYCATLIEDWVYARKGKK